MVTRKNIKREFCDKLPAGRGVKLVTCFTDGSVFVVYAETREAAQKRTLKLANGEFYN